MIATPTAILVRPAAAADLPRLGRLGALLVEVHHEFDAQRFLPTRNRMPADYGGFLATQLKDANAVILVADDGGDVVGYAYATIEGYDYMTLRGPAGIIQDIVVDLGMRRQGIGRALLDGIIAELSARGVPQIVLSTAALNNGALQLFASGGFHPTMIEMTRSVGAAVTQTQQKGNVHE